MDDNQRDKTQDQVRRQLKVLLLYLAAKSESPAAELQSLLRDVLEELHSEVKQALQRKPHLHLVGLGEHKQFL